MGTRIEPPMIIGALCGLHVLNPNVPKFLYAMFSDIVTCPGDAEAPNGETFEIVQDALNPCLWANPGTSGPWDVTFRLFAGPLRANLTLRNGAKFYFTVSRFGAYNEYDLIQDGFAPCGAFRGGHSGSGRVWWLSTVFDQVSALNLPTDGDGLFLETFRVSDTQMVNRFANTTYSLNKKLLFSP